MADRQTEREREGGADRQTDRQREREREREGEREREREREHILNYHTSRLMGPAFRRGGAKRSPVGTLVYNITCYYPPVSREIVAKGLIFQNLFNLLNFSQRTVM